MVLFFFSFKNLFHSKKKKKVSESEKSVPIPESLVLFKGQKLYLMIGMRDGTIFCYNWKNGFFFFKFISLFYISKKLFILGKLETTNKRIEQVGL